MKKRILVIDDNEGLVSMIKEYFNKSNYASVVLDANNGKDGLELIKTRVNDYDIVLLDLIMPHEDGIYVLKNMRKEGIENNVIVLTSFE